MPVLTPNTKLFRRTKQALTWKLLFVGSVLSALLFVLTALGLPLLGLSVVVSVMIMPLVYVSYLARADLVATRMKPLVIAAILGVVLSLPIAILLEFIFGLNAESIASAFGVGIVEEGAKLLAAWIVIRKAKKTLLADALIVGAAVGLGFETVETLFYVVDQATTGEALFTLALRSFLSPFTHATWSAVMAAGVFAYVYKRLPRKDALWLIASPVILHGLWDVPFSAGFAYIQWLILIGCVGLFLVRRTMRAANAEQVLLFAQVLSPTGTPSESSLLPGAASDPLPVSESTLMPPLIAPSRDTSLPTTSV